MRVNKKCSFCSVKDPEQLFKYIGTKFTVCRKNDCAVKSRRLIEKDLKSQN